MLRKFEMDFPGNFPGNSGSGVSEAHRTRRDARQSAIAFGRDIITLRIKSIGEHVGLLLENGLKESDSPATVDVKGSTVDGKGSIVDVKSSTVDVKDSTVDVKGSTVDRLVAARGATRRSWKGCGARLRRCSQAMKGRVKAMRLRPRWMLRAPPWMVRAP
eukprot:457505-Pyramimonas_sp.AAC.1